MKKAAARTCLLLLAYSLVWTPAGWARSRISNSSNSSAGQRDDITGRYVLRHLNVRGNLKVQLLSNNRIRFSLVALLLTAGGETRNGEVEGTLELKDNTAMYQNGQCRIYLKFLKGRVVVKESNVDDCGFGAFVTAEGTYLRRSRKPGFD